MLGKLHEISGPSEKRNESLDPIPPIEVAVDPTDPPMLMLG